MDLLIDLKRCYVVIMSCLSRYLRVVALISAQRCVCGEVYLILCIPCERTCRFKSCCSFTICLPSGCFVSSQQQTRKGGKGDSYAVCFMFHISNMWSNTQWLVTVSCPSNKKKK
uniref:Putative secreted protein n=1 Tax=Rhipicephalus microplus TaxID=6941 RepID=A0A6G5A3L0_RHIMP